MDEWVVDRQYEGSWVGNEASEKGIVGDVWTAIIQVEPSVLLPSIMPYLPW